MINNITLMGRLTKEPELKTTDSGLSVTAFSLAVDRAYQRDKTDFINCVAWRKTADTITSYFHKGDMIALVGELQTRDYTDKNGNKRIVYEVIVSSFSFCGSKSEQKTVCYNEDIVDNNTPENDSQADFMDSTPDDDDLPF